jgi:hypothetical protein
MNSPLYITSITPEGKFLLGGIWKLYSQEGYPLEMSHLSCPEGHVIDWFEAMLDASTTNECPSLMDKISDFLPRETLSHLKRGFVLASQSGKTYQQLLDEKRQNATRFAVTVATVAGHPPKASL